MPESTETRLARVDQRLSDFIERTDKHLDTMDEKLSSTNNRLVGFAFTIATSAVGIVLGLLVASGKL